MKYVLALLLITVCGLFAEPPALKSKAALELLKHPEFKKAMEAAPEFTKAVLNDLDRYALGSLRAKAVLEELDQHAAEALREKVVGKYRHKDENGDTHDWVFLETGIKEKYLNDKKSEIDPRLHAGPSQNKWRIVGGELHVRASRRFTDILKLNPDNSLTQIGYLRTTGGRTDWPKGKGATWKRVE